MAYLVNLSVQGRPVVVVGAGRVALRKVNDLLEAGASVTVIAPSACDDLKTLAAGGRVRLVERPYGGGEVAGAFLAVAATDDEALNARVSAEARSLGVLVNVVDRPALCSFTLPAVVRRGDLRVAVSTEGRCPALAAAIRRELESRFGPAYAELTALMGRLRAAMLAAGWEGARVRGAIASLYERGLAELLAEGRWGDVSALLREELGEEMARRFSSEGAGPP